MKLKSLRLLLLAWPAEVCLVAAMAVVSAIFTLWPTALEHSPIAFDTRGVVHHVWHYLLLFGGSLAAAVGLYGVAVGKAWSQTWRVVGLLLLWLAVFWNTAAVTASAITGATEDVGGLDLALRFAVLGFFAVRIHTLRRPPWGA